MLRKRPFSLSLHLILLSSTIVLISVVTMGVLFSFFLSRRFRDYIIEENSESRMELVQNISRYLAASGTVDPDWMEQFSNVYMERGMFISINSPEGDVMWSCPDNNSSACSMHMDEIGLAELENLEQETYEIPLGDQGDSTMLNISYVPADRYSVNDRFFLTESFRMLLLSALLTLGTAVLLTIILSRSISRPLIHLTGYAIRLAAHDYRAADRQPGRIREIASLHEAVEKLAASLETQELLRKRLAADISHELRTPLASLQSTLEAMIDGIWPADGTRLENCRSEILRLTGLVEKLDDLHRYDRSKPVLSTENFKLKKSLKAALTLFRQDFEKKGIETNLICPEIVIQGDNDKLKQVWINILSNSLKYSPDGGLIEISVRLDGDVEIRFTDRGEGIAPEDLPHVFERFYKADPSRGSDGSGLGLSIVKEIVELHGGAVSVRSERNRYTEVLIKLPAV